MNVILASASPRRRQLLKELIPTFDIIPAKGAERVKEGIPPEEVACALATQKCSEVFACHPESIVIGCDTIVVFEGTILGKPKDKQDALRMLTMLSGKTHEVITGVCIRKGDSKWVEYEKSVVEFNSLTQEFIERYIEGGSPMDKAGAYGIQDGGVVKRYVGSYSNIVGLPLERLKKMLDRIGEDYDETGH